jgi:hypothetical protein
MKTIAPESSQFHQMFGPASRRIAYRKSDFIDYMIMILFVGAIIVLTYRSVPWLALTGIGLCLFLVIAFPIRHGFALTKPAILRTPLDILYSLTYRFKNITWVFIVALAVIAADNLFIILTPDLPHQTELMRTIALWLFFAHFLIVSSYRTLILVSHMHKHDRVREFLMETTWKKTLIQQPSVYFHLIHAWTTGILTHLVLIAPWYIIIMYTNYSVISFALILAINIIVHYFHMQGYPRWFYREHWVGHQTEFDFIYMHGTHHDAIPCSLIGVSGNGILEGFLRDAVGNPMALYSPVVAFCLHTVEVVQDMRMHQYIPGIYPQLPRWFHEVSQHSTHHFGRLEPYGIGLRLKGGRDQLDGRKMNFPPIEVLNSIELDEALSEFVWDNPRHRRFLALYDRYQPDPHKTDETSEPS